VQKIGILEQMLLGLNMIQCCLNLAMLRLECKTSLTMGKDSCYSEED